MSRRLRGTTPWLARIGVIAAIALAAEAHAAPPAPDTTFRRLTAFHFEGMGSGKVYSLNLDRRVTRGAALRMGFGMWPGGEAVIYAVPLAASALIGTEDLCLELSGGPMFLIGEDLIDFGSNVIVTTFAGIRYEPRQGGLFLRGGIGPIYGGGNWEFWPTVSLGYAF